MCELSTAAAIKGWMVAAVVAGALIGAALASCSSADSEGRRPAAAHGAAKPTIAGPSMGEVKPHDFPGLHNVVAFHEGFYSGSVPEGEEGFETLVGMGVKTIISVDGAAPDVAEAKANGMRYIHLPIGYNGFDEQRKLELVRATRDAMRDGPVYMHCHHGKHRSAGAAGTVAVCQGWMTPEEATERMRVSGTAPSYKGLYACTAEAVVLQTSLINAVPARFPEVSHPAGFVKVMVEIDEINEHLKAIEKAEWKAPKDHPDLVPAAEAGRMADLFRLVAKGERAKSQPAEFAAMLTANGAQVQALEEMLVSGASEPKQISAQFALINASCKACHGKYRD